MSKISTCQIGTGYQHFYTTMLSESKWANTYLIGKKKQTKSHRECETVHETSCHTPTGDTVFTSLSGYSIKAIRLSFSLRFCNSAKLIFTPSTTNFGFLTGGCILSSVSAFLSFVHTVSVFKPSQNRTPSPQYQPNPKSRTE